MTEYIKRNHRWITPLLFGLFVVGGGTFINALPGAVSVPRWLLAVVGVLACVTSGMGAARTQTTSARLLWFVGSAALAAGIFHNLLRG